MTSPPRLSIVLPTYNGARWLAESIDSCLSQTYRDLELIVVVDGSTDETPAILARYDDPRLRVITKPNGGLPRALNTGFDAARGELLSWTSDDNVYLPRAMEVMVEYLDAHPSTPMVCTDTIVMNDAGRDIGYSDQTWACFVYRRTAAEKTGPYRPEYSLVEDVDFFLRLQHFAGPIARIREPHYRYRHHDKSLSATQLRRRHLASLKLHYDLIMRKIEREDLRELFFERLSKAAMTRDHATMDEMLAFAAEKRVPFYDALARRDRLLRSTLGWAVNRLWIAARSRADRLRSKIALIERRLKLTV
jgi:glycosyltransferase involved in cell wall biosynthesis